MPKPIRNDEIRQYASPSHGIGVIAKGESQAIYEPPNDGSVSSQGLHPKQQHKASKVTIPIREFSREIPNS